MEVFPLKFAVPPEMVAVVMEASPLKLTITKAVHPRVIHLDGGHEGIVCHRGVGNLCHQFCQALKGTIGTEVFLNYLPIVLAVSRPDVKLESWFDANHAHYTCSL